MSELSQAASESPETQKLLGQYNRVRVGANVTASALAEKTAHQSKSITDYLPVLIAGHGALGHAAHAVAGAAAGAVLGEEAGGHEGAGLGALGGLAMGAGKGWLLKQLIREGPAAIAAYGDKIGLMTAAHAVADGTTHLSSIPSILSSATREIPSGHFGQGMRLIYGDNTLNKPEGQGNSTEGLSKALSSLSSTTHLSEVSSVLQRGAPTVEQTYREHTANKLAYIQANMPKDTQLPNQPFVPDTVRKSSDIAKRKFADKMEIVNDPSRIMEHVKYGTLTGDHIDALNSVYPEYAAQIKQEVMKFGLTPEGKKMPYQMRLSASMLTGQPLDPALARVPAYQACYTSPEQPKPGTKPLKNLPASQLSSQQRVQSGMRS
jgi:hypothetical protein